MFIEKLEALNEKVQKPKTKDLNALIDLIKGLSLNQFNKVNDFVQKLGPDRYYSGEFTCTTYDDVNFDVKSNVKEPEKLKQEIIQCEGPRQALDILNKYLTSKVKGTRVVLSDSKPDVDVFVFTAGFGSKRKIWLYK